MAKEQIMTKKMSAFEHALLQEVNPEKAKEFEPYTIEEEQKMREANLREQVSKLKVINQIVSAKDLQSEKQS